MTPRALLVPILALAGCGGSGDDRPCSAILITLDTTRQDALGTYGVHAGVTPHLDALAAEGIVYERAYTVAPLTLPAHASMLTGCYPPRHSVRVNGLDPLPSSAVTLAERAADAGLATAAFVGSVVLDRAFGLDQGFATYGAPSRPQQQSTAQFAERDAMDVVDEALAWFAARDRAQRFFVWIHLFDPHAPYRPWPNAPALATAHRDYYGEVAHADLAIGKLVAALRADGTLDQTAVMVAADHGEALGEHGEATHGHFCYEATLLVPLLLRHPDGTRAGERSREIVSVVDVFPTLLDAMQLAAPAQHDGHSLWRQRIPLDRGVYFESYSGYIDFNWSPLAGWHDARAKYIHSSRPELYDVAADPREQSDLSAARSDEAARCARAIAAVCRAPALASDGARIPPRLIAAVEGLGYAGAVHLPQPLPDPLAATDLPAPASMVATFGLCQQAMAFADEGRSADAVEILQTVLRGNPRNWFALGLLGQCHVDLGRPEDAIAALEPVVRDGPQRAGTHYNLGISYFNLGHLNGDARLMQKGVAALEEAVRLDPTEPVFVRDLDAMQRALEAVRPRE